MSDIQTSQFIDPDFAQVFHSWCNYYGEMWRSSTQSTVHLLLVHFIVWIVSIMWSLLKVAESQKSFRFASNLQKKRCQITLLSIFSFPFFQARGLAHFFGYLSKSKKLFAVKLPLLAILFLMVHDIWINDKAGRANQNYYNSKSFSYVWRWIFKRLLAFWIFQAGNFITKDHRMKL